MNFNNGFRITGNDSQYQDLFGWSTSLNSAGNIALVGAANDDIGALGNAGSAYIFTGSGQNWTQVAKITGSDEEGDDTFGNSIALNSIGNIALIGAPNKGPLLRQGAAYIFTGNGNNWVQAVKINASDPAVGDYFGTSVSINSAGNVAIVTAPYQNAGAAYIFTGSGSNWVQTTKITPSDGVSDDAFGTSVSINSAGNIVLVGGFDQTVAGQSYAGAAYVFTGSGSNWVQTKKITASDPSRGAQFSENVSLNSSGNVAAIAARWWPNTTPLPPDARRGAVYIYTGNGSNWTETIKLTGDNSSLFFGNSLSLNSAGNTLAVGTSKNIIDIFTGSGSNWIKTQRINPSGTNISSDSNIDSISLNSSGDIILAGTPYLNNYTGAAYIFTTKSNQTITFNSLDTKSFGDPLFYLTGFSDSNLALTYSSSNSGIAIITGTSGVLITGAGSSIITGSQTGNGYYNAATPVARTLTVNKANQTISFSAIPTKTLGDSPFFLDATATSNLPVTFSGSNPSVATIVGSGVTIINTGVCEITGYQTGNSNYNSATPISRTLTVKASQTISFPTIPTKTFGDLPFFLNATSTSNLPVTFSGSNPSVATIVGSGVTIVTAGTSEITGYQTGNDNYSAATPVARTLTVNKANQTISFSAIPTKTLGDSPFFLDATATSSLPVTFSGSNPSVATIVGSGVTIINTGISQITGYQTGNLNYNAATPVARTLTVKSSQTITFSAIPTKTFGDPLFYLSGTSTSNLPLIYSGSNSNVATIFGSGVTIVGAGTCQITGYQTGNDNYSAATPVSQTLTVLRGSQTINISGFYTGIYNETKVYDASTPQGLPLIYTGNTNIFSISSNNITFINTGVSILTGYNTGNLNYTGITGTQQVTVNRANAIIDFPYIPVFNISVTSGYTLNATSNHNESTITYTSSNSGAASISGANTLLITGTGVGIITAYQPATSHYNEASGQRSFTALNLRNPQIVAVSNLPNNVFFDTGSKYIQGYLQDEGTYHLKLHILEDNILCEKTIILNVIDTGVKHLYKINYPINIGFIKYNAPQRLGL